MRFEERLEDQVSLNRYKFFSVDQKTDTESDCEEIFEVVLHTHTHVHNEISTLFNVC